jgi:hypothetical protein
LRAAALRWVLVSGIGMQPARWARPWTTGESPADTGLCGRNHRHGASPLGTSLTRAAALPVLYRRAEKPGDGAAQSGGP